MQGDDSHMPRLDRPVASLVIYRAHVKQISPDKSMNFPCTAASFTVAVRSHGFDVLYPKHFVGQALPSRLQPTLQTARLVSIVNCDFKEVMNYEYSKRKSEGTSG